MFIEMQVNDSELPALSRQIEQMRNAVIAMVRCVEYMRASRIPITRNQAINQAVLDIYRAVQNYTDGVERIEKLWENPMFSHQFEMLLEADNQPRVCDYEVWCATLTSMETRFRNKRSLFNPNNTGARHARKLVFDLQEMMRDFDPDEIDWDLDTIKMRIKFLEQKFNFMREFFRMLPPVQ
ncbi:MAG: hypothetical protein ABIA83_01550 [Patescibacteria group bacterium]